MIGQFPRLSFRKKILATYFLLLLFTFIVFMICYIEGVSSALSYNVEYMKQANKQKNMNLDIAMGNNSSLNFLHFIDSKINIILHEKVNEMNAVEQLERNNYLQKTLKLLSAINSNVHRASILTETGDFYCSVPYLPDEYLESVEETIKTISWQSRSQRYYTNPYPQKIGSSGYSLVTIIHQMSDIGVHNNFAYLLIDLDFGSITEDFNSLQNSEGMIASFVIFNGSQVVYNSRNASINLETELDEMERRAKFPKLEAIAASEEGYGEVIFNDTLCVASVLKNESTGWYLVHYIPKTILVNKSMAGMIHVMIWVIIILFLAGSLSLILSKQVSKPIQMLSETMSHARQGRVRLYTGENKRKDEVGQLIDSYNAMGQRINDSITQLYIAQLNQKEAELKMLQFQINPHFLYNALNTVTAISRLEDIEEIPAITESLSDMFRYNIKGNDFVALKEEVNQLQNYLRIQSIRFPKRFLVEYDIPKELEEYGVIKFILQPLVENSIHHAFHIKRSRDCLKISARLETDGFFLLSVYDDGCGIKPEEKNALNRKMEETEEDTILGEDGNGIGLGNVNARLKNFYGQECGITVESELGEYTCIQMRLKLKR